jgi:bifunctional non-homologous end joining protein LigD
VKKPKATWVRPEVEAEIQFGGITDDGLLREAVFKGLREDLAEPNPAPKRTTATAAARPSESRREKPHIGVPRENILQLLPDAVVPTKDELLAYWRKVGSRALEHLGRRPLKLVRHTHSTTFYHKGPLPPDIPEAVHRLMIEKREGGEGTRLWVDSVEGLLGLVRAVGAVELHPWNASVDDIERPDQLVFDLDPGKGVEWPFVVDTAMALRELLEEDGFATWPKVTGGKGVHVMVPIAPDITHDEAHRYCRSVAERTAATDPGRYTVSASIAERGGRLFIDYLRNGRGTTAVGAFSPRARPGFPLAAPVSWADLHNGIRADAFTLVHPPVKRAPARRERSSNRSKSRNS